MKFSIIIPVYNRPDEINELLESLTRQSFKEFEVVIVEDGSTLKCENIVKSFQNQLNIRYYYKENSGQGFSRNFGYELAEGDYFIVFDSDCIIPDHYLELVHNSLSQNYLDAYGGPDRAHPDFSPVQKAISYSMTSLFTTGGIRGNKKRVGVFHPRSFNMGISKEVYKKTNGYVLTRMAEDLELSIRIIDAGFKVGLIEDAYVYHKRRTSFKQFFKQLHFFGRGRINIYRYFPSELKIVHFFPVAFFLFCVVTIISALISPSLFLIGFLLLSFYSFLIFVDSSVKNKSLKVGVFSVVAAFTQLWGYGIGFLEELVQEVFHKKKK